jgi:thymidine phosphorylase
MLLGAGRETVDAAIDPAVGIVFHKKVGDPVAANEPIATVHLNSRTRLDGALALLRGAIDVRPQAPQARRLVIDILT